MQYNFNYNNELAHYGIEGMRWGIRRFQNPDGTLTADGKKRYEEYGESRYTKKLGKKVDKLDAKIESARNNGNVNKANKLQSKRDYTEKRRNASKKYDEMKRDVAFNHPNKDEYTKTTAIATGVIAGLRLLRGDTLGVLTTPLDTLGVSNTYQASRAAGESKVKAIMRSQFDIGIPALDWSVQSANLRNNYIKKHIDD